MPHKAVAEVSQIGNLYERLEVGCCEFTGGRANPLMDRQVAGAVFFGVVATVAVVTLPYHNCWV